MTAEEQNRTPDLSECIKEGIRAAMLNINTCMPGIVQSYSPLKNTADVQPVFKRKYENGDTADIPVIRNVPVAFPRAGTAAITFPIKPNDNVLLLFSQRTLDQWKTFGGKIQPNDPRTHDLSDAIAIPGVYPASDPVPIDPDNLVIRNLLSKIIVKKTGDMTLQAGGAIIEMTKSGQVKMGNGVVDLLDLVDKLLDAILKMSVGTALGPSTPPLNSAEFTAIKTQLATIKG